jgi:hypothetical protein
LVKFKIVTSLYRLSHRKETACTNWKHGWHCSGIAPITPNINTFYFVSKNSIYKYTYASSAIAVDQYTCVYEYLELANGKSCVGGLKKQQCMPRHKLYVAAWLPFTALGLRGRKRSRSRFRIPHFRVGIKLHWAANPRLQTKAHEYLNVNVSGHSNRPWPQHSLQIFPTNMFLFSCGPGSKSMCAHTRM